MADVLLRGPAGGWFGGEEGMRLIAKELVEARGSAAQTGEQVGEQLGGEGELEFSFKPGWDLGHVSWSSLGKG